MNEDMVIDGAPMRDNSDALMELSGRQCITKVRDSGEYLTAENLAKHFLVDINELQKQLADWRDRGELFSVQDAADGEVFPVFAFENSGGLRVLEGITRVLDVFRGRVSPCGIAVWFIGLSSYLDDQRPQDLLRDDPDWVIEAARDWIGEASHG